MRSLRILLLLLALAAAGTHSWSTEDEDAIVDFPDTDASVKGHWALLVAGSAGWGNYRHQADVYHAYHVLRDGGLSPQRMVVMAYDDIASDPENPFPGRVYNKPGGPDVYKGVRIDYRGEDVTADTFLAVLEGRAAAVANKGSGRVIASGPNDRVFVFYSDHGSAGVLGMPSGAFLYADQLLGALNRKAAHHGFKEMVLYIEACESGSMFEGLLDENSDIYVTTAANALESSWATYCPDFFTNQQGGAASSRAAASNSLVGAVSLVNTRVTASEEDYLLEVAEGIVAAGVEAQQQQQQQGGSGQRGLLQWMLPGGHHPTPEMTTCLGDLYSVAWMENSEEADLTHETLLQQYKLVKGRTSNNYTYNQGSHVMQYGALDIDREVAGNYIGMNHTGNVTPSASPGDISSDAQQRRGGGWQGWLQRWLSEAADWLAPVDTPHTSAWVTPSSDQGVQQRTLQHMHPHHMSAAGGAGSGVEAAAPRALAKAAQRHADLLPLMASATRSPCPRRRAAALGKLAQEVQQRRRLDRLAAAVGSRMLPGGVEEQQQQGLPAAAAGGGGVANGGSSAGAGAAKQRQQQRAGVVQDWECLRGMVQAWEGSCGALREYGMRHMRLLARLCNAGSRPADLQHQLQQEGLCGGRPAAAAAATARVQHPVAAS